jgi:hypothetical protein
VSYIILEESGTPGNAFIKTWSALSPETLIPKLGVPSSVKVDGYCGEGEGSLITDCSYNLYVSYQRSGIYLNYTLGSRFGLGYPICPTFEEGGNTKNWFRIILKSLDEQTVLGYIGNGYLGATPFEEATGKTINDFYQAYLQSQKPPCFYLLPSFFK